MPTQVTLIQLIRDYLHDDVLHDDEYDRYTDEIILKYINLGLVDFIAKTNTNKKVAQLPYPTNKIPKVELPKGKVHGVTIDGCTTPVVNGNLGACPKDSKDKKLPVIILTKDTVSVSPLGSSGDNLLISTEYLDFDEHLTPQFGALSDLSDYKSVTPLELNSMYGAIRVVTPILMSKKLLLVSYSAIPTLNAGDAFPLDPEYELCIKHFVCGHLLRDDKESQDISLGREELSLYNKCVDLAKKKEDGADNDLLELDSDYVYTIPYRGLF